MNLTRLKQGIYWRWLYAVIFLIGGMALIGVSLWRQTSLQMSQELTPPLAEQPLEMQADLLAHLNPTLYDLPDNVPLPMSYGYITATARQWLSLVSERGTIKAVERRRQLAEERMGAALLLAAAHERRQGMEAAARGTVYLSRATEDLQSYPLNMETLETWRRIHNTAEKMTRALDSFHKVMPVEWRASVDRWSSQVEVVHSQAEEHLKVQTDGSYIDR